MPTSTTGNWALGVIMALIALLGLFMASGAVDQIFRATGLGLSLFGVLFIFFMIRKNTG